MPVPQVVVVERHVTGFGRAGESNKVMISHQLHSYRLEPVANRQVYEWLEVF